MSISVTEPISRAIERTRLILFRPFKIEKWFVLGFCAFLASLGGEGGGSGGCNFNIPSRFFGPGPGGTVPGPRVPVTPPPQSEVDNAMTWLGDNAAWFAPVVIVGLLAIVGLTAVVMWLGARGRFMLLDGIIQNQAAVREPWNRLRAPAKNLFGVTFSLSLIGLAGVLVVAAAGVALAWPDIRAEQFGGRALAGVLTSAALLLMLCVPLAIAGMLLRDFVAPTMYLTGQPVGPSWRMVRRQAIAGHVGSFVLFYLMRIVLGIAMGVIAVLAMCATCCIGALPYLSSVLLLPLIVFDRCYALYFLQQFGREFTFFQSVAWPPLCARCQYDLRSNTSGVCPECGTPIPPEQWALIRQLSPLPPNPPTTA